MRKQNILVVTTFAIVLFLGVGCSSVNKLQTVNPPSTTSTTSSSPTIAPSSSEKTFTTTATSDDGKSSITPVVVTVNCGSADCLKKQFTQCQPATGKISAGQLGETQYEIIGLVNHKCQMKTTFISSPLPGASGKQMTCLYDNAKSFEAANQEVTDRLLEMHDKTGCSGALADFFVNWNK